MTTTNSACEAIGRYIQILEQDKPVKCYEVCRRLTAHVLDLIYLRDLKKFRESLNGIMALYDRTRDNTIRLAIENILIFKISDTIMLQRNRRAWADALPRVFREKMCQQIFSSGL